MRLALAQMSSLNNMEANLNKSLNYVKEAAENQADIVLFPEVQLTNFFHHYPESIRTEALMGADVILIPTVNTKEELSEMFEWELRVQAFQNSVAIAMCNRVGQEGNMNFSGESLVVDANGGILAKADDTEQLMYIEIDVKEISQIRAGKNYTQLRRTELYK